MSFSLRKFFRIAYSAAFPDFLYHDLIVDEDNGEPITVCQGGYFLLPESTGLKSHLSQNNVNFRTFSFSLNAFSNIFVLRFLTESITTKLAALQSLQTHALHRFGEFNHLLQQVPQQAAPRREMTCL